ALGSPPRRVPMDNTSPQVRADPVTFTVGKYNEDVDYARRLSEAGVACELRLEPGMYHGADALLDGKAPSMTAFRAAALDALRTALAKP
ncbi:hypothetical protein ACFYX4_39445, partial [Streptomyces sp. NPDC002328]